MMPQPGLVPPVAMSSQKGVLGTFLTATRQTARSRSERVARDRVAKMPRRTLICCLGVCELRDKPANAETDSYESVSVFANSETGPRLGGGHTNTRHTSSSLALDVTADSALSDGLTAACRTGPLLGASLPGCARLQGGGAWFRHETSLAH